MSVKAAERFARSERRLRPGWFFEPRLVRVEIDGAPNWLRGLRLMFLSDVHLRPRVSDAQLEALVDRLEGARADMLLLGGDYAETPDDCRRFFEALARLRLPLGTFAVPGNNDRLRPRRRLREIAAHAGVRLLVNETARVTLPGGTLAIGGCDEHRHGKPRTAKLFDGGDGYRILLSHYPAPPDCECELMLSGHTHAGQFRLLGRTPYSLGYERRYRLMAISGQRRIGDMRLFVGNGIGVSKLPLRLNADPELYLLEFTGDLSRAKLPEKPR